MDRKLFGVLSGTHVTIIALAAIMTPAALYGAVTYSNVAVVNPSTGVAASVDASGRLTAVNPYSQYRDYAANQIEITMYNGGYQCDNAYEWAVPSGKAFIVTAVSGYDFSYSANYNYAGFEMYSGAGCSGSVLDTRLTYSSAANVASAINADYGVGIPVAAGSTLSVYAINTTGTLHIHGYLVPAAWVSASQHIGPTAPDARTTLAKANR